MADNDFKTILAPVLESISPTRTTLLLEQLVSIAQKLIEYDPQISSDILLIVQKLNSELALNSDEDEGLTSQYLE